MKVPSAPYTKISLKETSSANTGTVIYLQLVSVVAQSKGRTVFTRSKTVTVGSSPTQGIDVFLHLFSVCVVCR
jgi:hypothetical protein